MLSNKYQPHFDIDFERGLVGERLVDTFLNQLAGSKIEVKTDYRVGETGNVYVETWQYRNADLSDKKQSGINITEADYFCFASPSGGGFIMVTTDLLKELMREIDPPESRQPVVGERSNASVGRLVPVDAILRKIGLWR